MLLSKTNSQKSCVKAFTGSVGSNSSKNMNLGGKVEPQWSVSIHRNK